MQAHANQQTSQQYSSNYSPEVETEKPFKRKRKEKDLDGKVLCVFWWDRHCWVDRRQNRVVRKFAHAHIAILTSSCSDDVIAFEVKKWKILIRFLEFSKIWQRSYSLLAFLAFNFSEKFVRQGCRSAKKHKNAKNEKTTLTTPTFFDFKSFLLPGYTRFEHKFYRRKLKKIEIKPNRSKKWRCLSSFNLRLKALISEVTVEQQILALVYYVSVALIGKIAKRTRILTFDCGHWHTLDQWIACALEMRSSNRRERP